MNDLDTTTRLQGARIALVSKRPYLSTAAFTATFVVSERVPTLAIDPRWRIYANPEFVARLTHEQLVAVLYHELSHALFAHAERAQAIGVEDPAQHVRWNIAGDAEINDGLLDEGLPLPDGCVTPTSIGQPDDRLAEEYYAALEQAAQEQDEQGSGAEQDAGAEQDGQSEQDGQGSGQRSRGARTERARGGDAQGDDDTSEQGGSRAAGGQQQPTTPQCGSGAGGVAGDWEIAGEGDNPATKGVSPVEAAIARRVTAEQIREHARSRGDVPGSLARWADAVLAPPKLDWRRVLAGAIRGAAARAMGAVDYTYARPSRRQHALGKAILPVLRRPEPRVALVIDTSGSMGDEDLARARAEVTGVVRAAAPGVTVLSVDAAVHVTSKNVRSGRTVSLVGGGGTDMRVGIAAACALTPRPHVVVVLTDGETPWPEDAPAGVRVIVVLTQTPSAPPPAWARVISIAD